MIAQIDNDYLRTRPTKLWSRLISYSLFEGRPITTPGQWINPLVFKSFKLWEQLPQFKEVKSPIFIIGMGRSGTTILGIILSIHKSVSYLNEPKALWHEVYSKEDIIGSYSNGEAYYSLNEKFVTENVKNRANKIYGAYLALTGGERVVDKYPELIFRVPFIKEIFPDAKFLFITRNGKDTLQSIEHWSKRLGKTRNDEVHDWWGVNDRKWKLLCDQLIPESKYLKEHKSRVSQFQDHKDRATVEWILTMEKGLQVKELYNESIFQFKYEDLLGDHIATLDKILEVAELPLDNKLFEYANKIIEKPAPKKNIIVHPVLKGAFEQLMWALGYDI